MAQHSRSMAIRTGRLRGWLSSNRRGRQPRARSTTWRPGGTWNRACRPAKDIANATQWRSNSPGGTAMYRRQLVFQCPVPSLLGTRLWLVELPCLYPRIIAPHRPRTAAQLLEQTIKGTTGVEAYMAVVGSDIPPVTTCYAVGTRQSGTQRRHLVSTCRGLPGTFQPGSGYAPSPRMPRRCRISDRPLAESSQRQTSV